MKLTKRKGFNFFRSYYDVYNELENDKDKVKFIDALLDRQFQGIKPEGLKGMAKFAYVSQINSIDKQVKGYEDKTGFKFDPCQGVKNKVHDPSLQEQVQVQVQVQGKEKGKVKEEITFPFSSPDFLKQWNLWKDYKKTEHSFKFKSPISEQASLIKLNKLANQDESTAVKIIHQSIENGWKGFFSLKNENNESNSKTIDTQSISDKINAIVEAQERNGAE